MIPSRLLLKPLPYPFAGLAPAVSPNQVEIHYREHHEGYVLKANRLLSRFGIQGLASRPAAMADYEFARNGAMLHELYWETYRPGGSPVPRFFADQFGERMQGLADELLDACSRVHGSGWAFLSLDPQGELKIHTTANHSYPWADLRPLVVVDLWEHAYYLDRLNDRMSYVEALLPLIDWVRVEHRSLGRMGEPVYPA